MSVRAREFNRLIAPIANHGLPINLIAGTPRVDVAAAKCRRIDWDKYDDLDPSQGDARIIAEILNVRGVPEEQRVVVSQDINPLIMAQRHGLKAHHISESWLPQPEPSPQEKENAKLKAKLKEYEKAEPQFSIKLEMQSGPVEVYQVQKLTESEMSTLVKNIVAANPKPEQGQGLLSYMQNDSSLNDRYAKYERKTVPDFVRNYHKKLELLFGQIPFTLSVENTGKVRADHTNIDVQIVGGWFNTKPILAGLRPSAPKVRNPLSSLSPLPRPIPIRQPVGRHEIEVNEPCRSKQFSAQCEDFRHGQKWIFSGVVWLDPCYEGEVIIIVKATAANLHGESSKPFKFDKSVISSKAFDLVDFSTGKVVKDYYITRVQV